MSEEKPAEQPKQEENITQKIKEDKKKGPTLFQLLGAEQNKDVFHMFIFISLVLVVVSFGSFFLLRTIIPIIWSDVKTKDANVYACGISAFLTHAVILIYGLWARKYDLAEERREKEEKEKKEEKEEEHIKSE